MVALLSNGNFHYKWFIFDRTQIQQTKLKIIYSANVSSLSCPWKITWTGIVSIHHRLLLFLSLSESPDNMWKTIVIWEIIPGIQYAVNHHGVCLNTNKLLLTFSLLKTYSKVNNCLVSRALEISMWVGFFLFFFFLVWVGGYCTTLAYIKIFDLKNSSLVQGPVTRKDCGDGRDGTWWGMLLLSLFHRCKARR